jgi:hypothetical protein
MDDQAEGIFPEPTSFGVGAAKQFLLAEALTS